MVIISKGKYKIKNLTELFNLYDIELSCPIVIDDCVTDYYITNFGKVYRFINDKKRYLKLIEDDGGYLMVKLSYTDNKSKNNIASIMVNRLVAYAFIKNINPNEFTEVNHKDGDKHNNHVWNLEWCSHSLNMKHAYENDLHRKGEENILSIYSNKQIMYVCELLESNKLTRSEISKLTGVAIYTIQNILKHKKWTHISKNYKIDNYNIISENTGSKPKYDIQDIEKVCKLIEDGFYTLAEISNITGVGLYTICDIKRHRTWLKISQKYNF